MGGAHIGHCLRALSQRRGTDVVTIHGDRRRTGYELCSRIAEVSADISRLGFGAGERVALAGLNGDFYLEWLLAVPCAGAIVAPLNHRWVRGPITWSSVLHTNSFVLISTCPRKDGYVLPCILPSARPSKIQLSFLPRVF